MFTVTRHRLIGLEKSGATTRRRLFPSASAPLELPSGYADLLGKIKRLIQTERLRTVMAANSAMVLLYRDIGSRILERQER